MVMTHECKGKVKMVMCMDMTAMDDGVDTMTTNLFGRCTGLIPFGAWMLYSFRF